ncbi:MAG TPA: glycosyltransferase family 1 protein [Candidatus Acidoferrales bacterium]|nr:glycosyltransferase family 1 protein [Candidatus Acidoferrales bacterium]
MIRLAIDAANLAHDHRGMGRVVRPVVRAALADPRFAVTLLAQRKHHAALRADFGRDIRLRTASTARRRGRYDVVWLPFNGMRFACAAPVLVSIYDVFAFTEPARGIVARWREQAPIRRAARRAERVLTISHWSAEQIVSVLHVDPQRIVVVPPTPDPFFFPGSGDTLAPNLQGRRFVLFVGGPERRKNAEMLIEACAKALRAPDELLTVVGNLSIADEQRFGAYGVPFVRLRADDVLLRALYRNAALVAVPSRAEGFGLVAAEAMACGAPVIAADAAALPEATGDAALLVDPENVDAWAIAIRRLLDDPDERAAWSSRAKARYAASDLEQPIQATLSELFALGDSFAQRKLCTQKDELGCSDDGETA